ncbi:flavodoxin domain-containing protein [Alphaproteobacteria bacterium]|jgi:MioC protein|nr:flavodoxin domain-containing protein [Alphaproteobacteria bacterium]
MNRKLDIFVATMTGTALIVADEIVEVCEEKNIAASIKEFDNINYSCLVNQQNPILVISSTYGQGDVPDGSKSFYEKLKNNKPNLDHIEFAVFGLGDMTYKDTFAFGGKKFEELLSSLNAVKIVDSCFHDASAGTLPEEEAVIWFKEKVLTAL